jgi:hypothetical protein
MLSEIKKYFFTPVTDSITKLKKYLSDFTFITDLITKLVITFGVMLIVGGLYLMMAVAGQGAQTTSAISSVLSIVDWIPGVPVYINQLANTSPTTIGIISWIVGLDLLLVGLGLWVRHRLARFTALAIFALAAIFQFVQVLYGGIMGATGAFFGLVMDGILFYFLLSKYDPQTGQKNQLTV